MRRLRRDIMETQSAIDDMAVQKMSDITSLLSAGQAQRLRDLRKEEHRRLMERRNNGGRDGSAEAERRVPFAASFHMSSEYATSPSRLFDADEVFGYPERALWLDEPGNPSGFSVSGREGGTPRVGTMRELRALLEGLPDGLAGGLADGLDLQDFSFESPDDSREGGRGPMRRFEFRLRIPDEGRERSDSMDAPTDELMDATPYTLPRPRAEKDSPSGPMPFEKETMRKRMERLREALESLKRELETSDR
ncbi:MAG: hypothetical protein ACKOAG_07915 [Candidatus Kapaibacterium sp.]